MKLTDISCHALTRDLSEFASVRFADPEDFEPDEIEETRLIDVLPRVMDARIEKDDGFYVIGEDVANMGGGTVAIPLGRVAEPVEIAWPIAFLCSDAASYITGSILDVNGGIFMNQGVSENEEALCRSYDGRRSAFWHLVPVRFGRGGGHPGRLWLQLHHHRYGAWLLRAGDG